MLHSLRLNSRKRLFAKEPLFYIYTSRNTFLDDLLGNKLDSAHNRLSRIPINRLVTTFTTSAIVAGLTDDVLKSAVATLTTNGFEITHYDKTYVSLVGPGLNSTKQNPILGASKIALRLNGKRLEAEVELGGVDAMQRFLMWFPFLLGLGLGIFFGIGGGFLFGQIFGVGFGVPQAQGWKWMLVAVGGAMIPVSPWLILTPILCRMIRKRTQNAVEVLVRNATCNTRPS